MIYEKFNDDLLINKRDLGLARERFPKLAPVLDHKALRDLFLEYDRPANMAKKRSRRLGSVAIVLVTLGLLGAAASPLYHDLNNVWPRAMGAVCAVLGVGGVLVGLDGFLFTKRKRVWLHNRFMTERLRQFHFQTFVCRAPDIFALMAGDAATVQAFEKDRARWFERFRSKWEEHAQGHFEDALNRDLNPDEIWLHDFHDIEDSPVDTALLDQFFAAYRELRLDHQIGYADFKLRRDDTLFSSAPHTQWSLISNLGLFCIAMVFLIDMLIAVGVPVGWKIAHSIVPHVVAITFAIVALSLRAFDDGLKPRQELERYRDYRTMVLNARQRFDVAKTTREKLEVMRDMERISFEEMQSFLRTANESRFVM